MSSTTDEAARLLARVLRDEAPYLSKRGVRDLREALNLLEAEKEAQPVEYVAGDYGPGFAAWRREYRRRR